MSLPLVPGKHTVTSTAVTIGRLAFFANPNLQANISVWYEYRPQHNTLIFCSNDLVTPDSTRLTTFPQGAPNQTCVQRTYPGDAAPCGANPNWNYCTPVTPGLQQAFQNIVRTANQAIIDAARRQGYNVIVRMPFPPVSESLYHSLRLVYKGETFIGTFDPAASYDEGHTLIHPESAWYGEVYLASADIFANVIGSSGDPKIAGLNGLPLWVNQFGAAWSGTSLNYNGFSCGPGLLGQTATVVAAGSDDVFIVPICAADNNNDNVNMAPLTNTRGIALRNYLGTI